MTLEEACLQLNKTKSTLITNFTRTQKNLAKKGIILIKEGQGEKANYIIKHKEEIK